MARRRWIPRVESTLRLGTIPRVGRARARRTARLAGVPRRALGVGGAAPTVPTSLGVARPAGELRAGVDAGSRRKRTLFIAEELLTPGGKWAV